MLDALTRVVADGPEVHPAILCVRLLISLGAGLGVAFLYRRTRDGGGSESLPATLVMLAVLIAAVTQVIGDNVARAFSLVGALSIVRFRTVVRDTRDTAFVIFAVIVGMGVGAGHAMVAGATLAMGGLAAWVTGPGRGLRAEPADFDLTVRVALGQDVEALAREVFPELMSFWKSRAASTAKQGAALEVTWEVILKPSVTPADLVRVINRREGVQNVEVKPHEESL